MHILIVRACAIGDFVLNLPALQALQETHPGARFTLVGNPFSLELARDFVNVDSIHSIEAEPWRRLFYEPVDGLKFDQAVVWMRDPAVANNLRLSGIETVVRADPFPGTGHSAAHLLQTIALAAPNLPDRWRPSSDRWMLHPGSGSPKKCWPRFLELADQLKSAVFLVGPAESELDTGDYPRLEKLPLRDVTRALVGSRGFVGNDSGVTHLAGYLGCPTVAIFGPTDPGMWGPIGRRVRVLWKPDLRDIQIAEVAAKLRELE